MSGELPASLSRSVYVESTDKFKCTATRVSTIGKRSKLEFGLSTGLEYSYHSVMEPPNVPNAPPQRRTLHRQIQTNMPTPAISRQSSSRRPIFTMANEQQQQARPESSVTPHTTVAQMSFAPTTQTTVVTTTTTTTTSFPQLVMKPPRNLNTLDPKEFPLAAIPTPAPLKRFCFDIQGKPTFFREADDAESSMRQVRVSSFVMQMSRH